MTHIFKTFILIIMLFIIGTPSQIMAREYKSKLKSNKPQFETCRLIQSTIAEGTRFCVYKRQTKGPNIMVSIGKSMGCQKSFQCKRLR